MCFKCDNTENTGDFVQLVGRKQDLLNAELQYEVNGRNATMAKLTPAALDDADGDDCTWVVTQKEAIGAIKCTGGAVCDVARSAQRRIFLVGANGKPLAVFVVQPERAAPEDVVQVRVDRDDTTLTFLTAPNEAWTYEDECGPSTVAEARKDGDSDTTAASSALVVSMLPISVLAAQF